MAVDQEIRVLGDENIIANPTNSQKNYPLTFEAANNVIVYGRKKDNLNFTVPIVEGQAFNFNLERTQIIFADSFNLEEYSYIMVKNPFEEISDFFYVSSLEELDPTGKEFNEFNDEVVKWLRRLVNIISNRCMIFETTLFKDLNNFPNIKSGQTFIRTEDGWTGITIRDINFELDAIFNKYVEEVNKKIKEHETKMNELLEQWKQDIQKYAENVKQYEIVRVVTQSGHGFVFEPVMYSISQRKFVKAVFPHGADGVAVRVDDNNFRLVWAGRVEIPANAKDTKQRDFVLGEYYFLGEGSNGGIQREKPDTYYQHLFQVMYSDELRQNIADVLLSVPINQKGKRWDIGEAKTTVNDIEELKMSDFPVGKVVEVLGYYKAGDGANHKRIVSSTDDGSGVQLNNGLWADIVHNGEVNVSWFGIKDDIECRTELQSIINVASYKTIIIDKNIILQQVEGTDYLNSGIVLQRGVTIKFINDNKIKLNGINSPSSSVISIKPTSEKITLINPYLIGDKEENTSQTGEFGFGLSILDAPNLEILNFKARDCFGDGITLSCNGDIRGDIQFLGITDIQNCRRQGISVISGNGIYIEYLKVKDINGTSPMSAIDFEPAGGEQFIQNVRIDKLETDNCNYDLLVVSYDTSIKNISIGDIFSKNVRYCNLRILGNNCEVEIDNIYSNTELSESSIFARLDYPTNSKVHIKNAYLKNKNYQDSDFDMNESIIYYDGMGKTDIVCNMIDIDNLHLYNCNFNYFLYMFNVPLTQAVLNNMISSSRLGKLILKGNHQINLEDRSGERITLTEKNKLSNYTNPVVYITNLSKNIKSSYRINGDIKRPEDYEIENKQLLIAEEEAGVNSVYCFDYDSQEKTLKSNFELKFVINDDLNKKTNKSKEYYTAVKSNAFDPKTINENLYRGVEFQLIGMSENFSLIQTSSGKLFYTNSSSNSFKEVAIVNAISTLNTPYYTTKMAEEGGTTLTDFYSYLDEKLKYDKQLEAEQQAKYKAYGLALTTNPNLTYEEFMSVQPMTLNLVEEPQPSEALKKFMDKYL